MEEEQEFEGDNHLTKGTSFSRLIQGDDIDDDVDHHAFRCSSVSSIQNTPEMLCFMNHGTDSSSASSCIRSLNAMFKSNCNKKRTTGSQAGTGSHKKSKAENPTSSGHAKRKEKLGERIAALQKLVSPFGKSDTASVLHEAMGYIRFLHDQVQVLYSPYLQASPSSSHQNRRRRRHHPPPAKAEEEGEEKEEAKSKELRSKGLCLIPVECTINVANCNGADFWLPAMGNNINASWSSSTKK